MAEPRRGPWQMIFTISVLALILSLALFKVQFFDIWWHLRAGQYIVETRSVPKTDIFSYTAADREWINPSWLADVFLIALHNLGGINLLLLVKASLVAATMLVVYRVMLSSGADWRVALATLLLAALAARFRFILRPDTASGFFAAVFLWVLERHERKGGRLVYLLPVLSLLWANIHAGFLTGLILLAIFLFTAVGARGTLAAAMSDSRARQLLGVTVAATLAALVNPFGYKVFLYPLRLVSVPTLMMAVSEWRPIEFSAFFTGFWIMFALTFLVLILRLMAGGFDRRGTLMALVFGSMAISAQRHVFLFALMLGPTLAVHATSLLRRVGLLERLDTRWARAVGVAAGAAVLGFIAWKSCYASVRYQFGLGVREGQYPEKAIQFMETNRLEGNLFNDYNWGGYLIWRTWPKRKVFMDGRCDMYRADLLGEWESIATFQPGWEVKLDRRGAKVLLIAHGDYESLFKSEAWRVVYWDDISVVCVRNVSANEDVIRSYECGLSCPGNVERNLGVPELVEAAIEQLRRKVKSDPTCVVAHHNLGRAFMVKRDFGQAAEAFEAARKLAPNRPDVLNDLGFTLYNLGRYEAAVECYRAALRVAPSLAILHQNMGDCFAKMGRLAEAAKHYRKAIRRNPHFYLPYLRLGDVAMEQGDVRSARAHWEKALSLGGPSADLEARLADLPRGRGM